MQDFDHKIVLKPIAQLLIFPKIVGYSTPADSHCNICVPKPPNFRACPKPMTSNITVDEGSYQEER